MVPLLPPVRYPIPDQRGEPRDHAIRLCRDGNVLSTRLTEAEWRLFVSDGRPEWLWGYLMDRYEEVFEWHYSKPRPRIVGFLCRLLPSWDKQRLCWSCTMTHPGAL